MSAAQPTRGHHLAARFPWDRYQVAALALVTLIAALVRLIRLGDPDEFMFDETYYAKDACLYVHPGAEMCTPDGPQGIQVHPPLAKWLLAVGIRLFGFDSFGWRIAAAVAGTITVALIFLVARHLIRSLLAAAVASGLLALDLLHLAQSRIAMLDVFVPMFGMAAVLFLLYDRDRMIASLDASATEDDVKRGGLLDRPWRFAAGLAAGAAGACKWNGFLVLALVLLLTIAWEISSRRADGKGHAFRRALLEEGPSVLLWLMVVPLAFYTITYIGQLHGSVFAAPWSEGSWWRAFWDEQFDMFTFHIDFQATHPYGSPAWSWLLLKRPVAYHYDDGGGMLREVIAMGNPFTWWLSVLALLYVAARWVKRIDFTTSEGAILAGFLFMYLPWVAVAGRNVSFMFYLLPAVPFMCLAVAFVADRIWNVGWEGKTATGVFVAGTIASFIWYFPVVTNVPLSREAWASRLSPTILGKQPFSHCDKPSGIDQRVLVTTTESGKRIVRTEDSNTNEDLPPNGWCWI